MIKKLPYILSIAFVALLILSPFLIKVNIECKSQFGECPAEINSKLSELNQKKSFDARQKVSAYLKHNSMVSDFSIQFKLPDTMLINIIVIKPYFALKDTTSGKYELVDKNGKILSFADSSSLPTVAIDSGLKKVGETVSDQDLFVLNLVSGVYQMYQVLYGTITNDALVVDMTTGVRVIFPLEGDPEILLGGLRLIYAKVTANYLGTYSQIDMRYKNPVLR